MQSCCNVVRFDHIHVSREDQVKLDKAPQCVVRVLRDIDRMLDNPRFDRSLLAEHILNKLVQMTGSEYGFIGKMTLFPIRDGRHAKPELTVCSATNSAWVASGNVKLFNMVDVRLLQLGPLIQNEGFAAHHGDPSIKRVLCVPSLVSENLVALFGACNKVHKYTRYDLRNVRLVLRITAYLFLRPAPVLTPPNKNK